MRRYFLVLPLYMISTLALFIVSCNKNNFFTPQKPEFPNQSFVEGFDTANAALARGWQFINVSSPAGDGRWQDGGAATPFFPAYSNHGVLAGFIGTDYTSTSADQGTISNWLVSPSLWMQNGDHIIFYTRAYISFNGINDTTDFGNSLEVRINPTDDSVNVGKGLTYGNFSYMLLDINPNLVHSSVLHADFGAYPVQWTRFNITVSGFDKPVKSHFAFRYFVTNGGFNGNASGIGIDSVAYQSVGY